MKENFRQIEAQLKFLIEKQAIRILGLPDAEAHLAERLVGAMESEVREDENGDLIAPNIYTLNVPPKYAPDLQANQALLASLSQALRRSMQRAKMTFNADITINVFPDENVEDGKFEIYAMWRETSLIETKKVAPITDDQISQNIPPKAFLIVGGSKVFTLEQEVVNIGRKLENHLVIDDPRVSRNHGQLRAVKGSYMIFDLDSSGGTFVNGERITQTALYPGDVVSLAGVPIVYGQDAVNPITDTQEYKPPTSTAENTTAAVKLDELDLDTFDD
ncbi:FhaA domain-containing protein [Chloroflexota bacterium]